MLSEIEKSRNSSIRILFIILDVNIRRNLNELRSFPLGNRVALEKGETGFCSSLEVL